jgi:hypothetical protein
MFFQKAEVPDEYKAIIKNFTFDVKNIYKSEKILELDDKKIEARGMIDFYLLNYHAGDTVKIKSVDINNKITVKNVVLKRKYDDISIAIMVLVALFYFYTGIFILLRYKNTAFAHTIHMACVGTAIMVIFDWGDLTSYSKGINFLLFVIYESGIYIVPTMFFHFSFNYPVRSKTKHSWFLAPFYFATATFILISIIQLANIFYFGKDISDSYFIYFHTTVSDLFLIIGIIMTIAKLEHSALTIEDVTFKKQIYWALLGISFGPLIFVFMRLIPRLLTGYELVNQVLMEFTTVIAPIMLLISVTRNKRNYAE